MTMTLRVAGNRVLLRKDMPVEKVGSIIIPGARGQNHTATVVNVGPGKISERGVLIPCSLKEGDLVIYNGHGGQPIMDGEEELWIFYEHDIFAVIEE
jgi:chaperonin GroES